MDFKFPDQYEKPEEVIWYLPDEMSTKDVPPWVLKAERELTAKLKRLGLSLLADRTKFTDSHYCGGYAIADESRFLVGSNYELTLSDVEEWLERMSERNGLLHPCKNGSRRLCG